jgi:hypothetical protein
MNSPLKLDSNGNPTADSGLGPVIPQPPPLSAPIEEHQAYQKYVQKHVPVGLSYYTYQRRTDPATKQPLSDSKGQPMYDRVMRTQTLE